MRLLCVLFVTALIHSAPARGARESALASTCRILLNELTRTDWGSKIEPGISDAYLRESLAMTVERLALMLIGRVPFDPALQSYPSQSLEERWLREVFHKIHSPNENSFDESAYRLWERESFGFLKNRLTLTDLFLWKSLHQRSQELVNAESGPRRTELYLSPLQGGPAPRGIGVVQLFPESSQLQEDLAFRLASLPDWELRPVVLFGSPKEGETVQSKRLLTQATAVTPWILAGTEIDKGWFNPPYKLHPSTETFHFAGVTDYAIFRFLNNQRIFWPQPKKPFNLAEEMIVDSIDQLADLTDPEEQKAHLSVAEEFYKNYEVAMLKLTGRIPEPDEEIEEPFSPRNFTAVIDTRLCFFSWLLQQHPEVATLPVDYHLGDLWGDAIRMDRVIGFPNALEIFRDAAISLLISTKTESTNAHRLAIARKAFRRMETKVQLLTSEKIDITFEFQLKNQARWLRIRFHN